MPFADPARRRQAQRDAQRRRRARGDHAGVNPSTPGVVSATDLARVVWNEVQAIVGAMPAGNPERARVLAQLVSVGLRAVEAADLTRRVEALEEAVGEPGTVLAWKGNR